jgi:hypothetical protein
MQAPSGSRAIATEFARMAWAANDPGADIGVQVSLDGERRLVTEYANGETIDEAYVEALRFLSPS